MRKSILALAPVLGAVALILASCASEQRINTKDIPDFYVNPPTARDTIYGVGEARMSTLSLSRTTALSRARDDIARQVQILVKNAVTDYAQQAGEGRNQQTINFTETISRQIANVTLSGVQTVKIEPTEDGTVYALVSYQVSALKDAANQQFQRNEAAAFAEFKADQALQALDSQIKNNPPKAGASTGGN